MRAVPATRSASAPAQHEGEGILGLLDPREAPRNYFAVVSQEFLTLSPLMMKGAVVSKHSYSSRKYSGVEGASALDRATRLIDVHKTEAEVEHADPLIANSIDEGARDLGRVGSRVAAHRDGPFSDEAGDRSPDFVGLARVELGGDDAPDVVCLEKCHGA